MYLHQWHFTRPSGPAWPIEELAMVTSTHEVEALCSEKRSKLSRLQENKNIDSDMLVTFLLAHLNPDFAPGKISG